MLRPTPVHLLFPEGEIDRARFNAIEKEARASGKDPWDPLAVSALPTVAAWVSEVRPGSADPHAVHAYSALVFYGMHALGEHGAVLVVSEDVGRALAEDKTGAATAWSAAPPAPSGYVQLPHNVFWVQTQTEAGEDVAEPVDGIFWAHGLQEEAPSDGVWVMMAAGLRSGRPGFNAVALDRVPFADIGLWADQKMREDGADFANLLPGGELAGFLTVATAGEALKLLARVWRHAQLHGTRSGPDAELPYQTLDPTS
jgi:hypothetical protein